MGRLDELLARVVSAITAPTAGEGSEWRRLGHRGLVLLGLLLVFGTYIGLASFYRTHGLMNVDEGFYALAARSVMEGKVPYRDFAYTQMPLLPYVNGLLMKALGFGLDVQRRINIGWGALGLLAVVLSLRQRFQSWEPGLVAAFATASSPHFVERQAMGKTYAAAGCFFALAFASIYVRGRLFPRAVAFALFATLAVGCRATLAPPLAIAGIALMIEARGVRQRLLVPALALAAAAVLLLPFFLLAPRAFVFDNVGYHLGSSFSRPAPVRALEWWCFGPAAVILAATAAFGAVTLARKRRWVELVLLAAAVLGILVPVWPASAYGEEVAPAMLMAGAAGVAAMWATGEVQRSPFRHVAWVLPGIVLVYPLPTTLPRGQRTADAAVAAGAFVRESAAPGPILAALPIVAVEAGREVVRGTEMGPFSAMAPGDAAQAAPLHLTTLRALTALVRKREPAAIVLGQRSWNFRWQVPSLMLQPTAASEAFEKAIKANYERAYDAGNIEVFLPISGAPEELKASPP